MTTLNKQYYERKAAGICTQCGKKPPKENCVNCQECLTRATNLRRERRARNKVARLCRECSRPAAVGNVRCEKHRITHASYIAKTQKKNIANGLCQCGRERYKNTTLCKSCLKSRIESNKRLYEKRKKEGLCTHCGKPLSMCGREGYTICSNCSERTFNFDWK